MYKRMSIRLVATLSEDLNTIAKKRGLSVNSLISEIAWDFVDHWNRKYAVEQPLQVARKSFKCPKNPSG